MIIFVVILKQTIIIIYKTYFRYFVIIFEYKDLSEYSQNIHMNTEVIIYYKQTHVRD